MSHQEAKVVYRRRKSQQKQAPVTGIDVLPDEALQHVLSFLPAREAVGTCVLARRWRHLWRSITALRISSGVHKLTLSEQEFDTLDSFVNNLLFHRERSAPLELCEFGVHALEDQMDAQIDSWIQHALLCKAQTIRVDYYYDAAVVHRRSSHLPALYCAGAFKYNVRQKIPRFFKLPSTEEATDVVLHC